MSTLVLCFLVAQITYSEGSEITLQADSFSFERVFPSPSGLLIPNQELAVVHVFDRAGKLQASLGERGGEEEMTLPSSAAWIPSKGQIFVYDAATRKYHVWDGAHTYVKTIHTDFPSFFQTGPLHETDNGFVAAVSLQDDLFLTARFNDSFSSTDFGYPVVNTQLSEMSPVLYRTWIAKANMYGGDRILAVQSLATEMTMLDTQLKKTGSVSLTVPGWRAPDYKKLKKVSRNPRELEKYHGEYSEIVALQSLQGSLFVVGFRNILSGDGYYFQCFDASTGNALGQTYRTDHPPVGSGFGNIYLRKKGGGMKLSSVAVQ